MPSPANAAGAAPSSGASTSLDGTASMQTQGDASDLPGRRYEVTKVGSPPHNLACSVAPASQRDIPPPASAQYATVDSVARSLCSNRADVLNGGERAITNCNLSRFATKNPKALLLWGSNALRSCVLKALRGKCWGTGFGAFFGRRGKQGIDMRSSVGGPHRRRVLARPARESASATPPPAEQPRGSLRVRRLHADAPPQRTCCGSKADFARNNGPCLLTMNSTTSRWRPPVAATQVHGEAVPGAKFR